MKRPIHGYMCAYMSAPEEEVAEAELRLFQGAQVEGYDLAVVCREVEEGGLAVLAEPVEELGECAVVVPAVGRFGAGPVFGEYLAACVVRGAGAGASADLCGVGGR
ncbi:hypothetical protein [Actinacidiphila sp. ITFR-21]|uniref:hypothetical protein n=1 Tax=Actinacidiphila sp. ITFR-21 TaxID=3075199 RepID=UPI00288C00AC|nr:hypothetical protein [Streptomyces sp. ITFR-21]WNI18131.1 hypothetical protein RLT57_23015 [Streptomyces sp. ITFR-21]